MKIELPSGYLRPGLATFEEAEWLFGVMADWPSGGWDLNRCLAWLSRSAKIGEPTQDKGFVGLVLIYCLPDDTRIGTCMLSYYGPGDNGPTTGVDILYAAVHPSHRGAGHFTALSDGMVWYCNQHLAADHGRYKVLPSAPQVSARAMVRGGDMEKDGRDDIVVMRKATVAATLTDEEKRAYRVTLPAPPRGSPSTRT